MAAPIVGNYYLVDRSKRHSRCTAHLVALPPARCSSNNTNTSVQFVQNASMHANCILNSYHARPWEWTSSIRCKTTPYIDRESYESPCHDPHNPCITSSLTVTCHRGWGTGLSKPREATFCATHLTQLNYAFAGATGRHCATAARFNGWARAAWGCNGAYGPAMPGCLDAASWCKQMRRVLQAWRCSSLRGCACWHTASTSARATSVMDSAGEAD
jgi:hypothetical protein